MSKLIIVFYGFIIGKENEEIMFLKWKIRKKKMNKLWTQKVFLNPTYLW